VVYSTMLLFSYKVWVAAHASFTLLIGYGSMTLLFLGHHLTVKIYTCDVN